MPGRVYSVSFSGVVTAVGGDTDLLEVLPADDKPVRLRGLCLAQISEVGDAQEEGLRVSIMVLPATVTTGNGTATTPRPVDAVEVAAGFTAKTNGATVATTTGAAITHGELGWNVRNTPYDFWYPDERFCPTARQGEALILRQQTTAADDYTAAMTFWLEEL